MRITELTTPQEVSEKMKSVMSMDAIPNMLLKNVGRSNGFVSEKKDYQFWMNRICGRQEQAWVIVLM